MGGSERFHLGRGLRALLVDRQGPVRDLDQDAAILDHDGVGSERDLRRRIQRLAVRQIEAREVQCAGEGAGRPAGTLTCALHLSRFDLADGEALDPPAEVPLAAYAVVVEDGRVLIEIPDGALPVNE